MSTTIEHLYRHHPCSNCPFRKDSLKSWLGDGIEEILQADSFVCHKTTTSKAKHRMQCAGHMILLGDKNRFVRMANHLNIPLSLKGQDSIFDDLGACEGHHKI